MLTILLITVPLIGLFPAIANTVENAEDNAKLAKKLVLIVTVLDLIISFIMWMLFNNNSKSIQFTQETKDISQYDLFLGCDGFSIYFGLLTTIIIPLAILSNWKSITSKTKYFLSIMLIIEVALLLIFFVLDSIMFYVFFESILAPLFILIGIFGSTEKVRASSYFFLYTFWGSLFMLLSLLALFSLAGSTDMTTTSVINIIFILQVFMLFGILIAFCVKTPVIYLNSWLLKAHVESPLSGSIILAAIVLKLSLYGVVRLILPLLIQSLLAFKSIVFTICVITILYASFSTIRTVDVKELIAYSSVSHAAVYFAAIASNSSLGIQGAIILGLAHGFVSSGLFIVAGGALYDRSKTRLITYYKGIAQAMPILSVLFFILCLGNCGAPLTVNFIGEFMSLYGIFEALPLSGIFASTSIILSAAFTIYMYNRIAFGGSYSRNGWYFYMPDLNKREFLMLLILVLFTVILGIYPSIILDSLQYSVTSVLYSFHIN